MKNGVANLMTAQLPCFVRELSKKKQTLTTHASCCQVGCCFEVSPVQHSYDLPYIGNLKRKQGVSGWMVKAVLRIASAVKQCYNMYSLVHVCRLGYRILCQGVKLWKMKKKILLSIYNFSQHLLYSNISFFSKAFLNTIILLDSKILFSLETLN